MKVVGRYWARVVLRALREGWAKVRGPRFVFPGLVFAGTFIIRSMVSAPEIFEGYLETIGIGIAVNAVLIVVVTLWRVVAIPAEVDAAWRARTEPPLRLFFDPSDPVCCERWETKNTDVSHAFFRIGIANTGPSRIDGVQVAIGESEPHQPDLFGVFLVNERSSGTEFSVPSRTDGRPSEFVCLAHGMAIDGSRTMWEGKPAPRVWPQYTLAPCTSKDGVEQGPIVDNVRGLVLELRLEHASGTVDQKVALELRDDDLIHLELVPTDPVPLSPLQRMGAAVPPPTKDR